MIRAVALDDEPLALRLLKAFCSRTCLVSLDAAFTSPVDMMVYAGNHDFDLIFLDIQMPGISGIDFLRQFPRPVMAIFTTAFSEFAVEGFNLRAVDYLLKPFEFDRFQQAIERARLYSGFGKEARVGEDIFVKADNGLQRIQTTQILYVENVANYVKIHLDGARYVLVRSSIREMEEKLRGNGFLRVHRSYIIPVAKVVSVRGRTIYLGYMEIPVGINFIKEVQRVFSQGPNQ